MDGGGRPVPAERPEQEHEPNRPPPRGTILIVALVLLIGGYFLTMKLREQGRLQDCIMSGRTNCAPIDSSSGR